MQPIVANPSPAALYRPRESERGESTIVQPAIMREPIIVVIGSCAPQFTSNGAIDALRKE